MSSMLTEIAQLGAWTGLSVGALATLAALFYFVAPLRGVLIAAAVTVIAAYSSGLYWNHVGRADVQAQWSAANAAAAVAAKARDAAIAAELEREFPATKADPDDAKILADLSAAASGSCQLGAAALRLRNHK